MDRETQRRAVWCELVSDVARATGEVRLKAAGSSMLPVLWPGDVVTIRCCEFDELQPGQIVLRRQEEVLTLHRIARIEDDRLVTRGDSLPGYDPPAKPHEIVGKVVTVSRSGRIVQPAQTLSQRIVAAILRRSRFCRRVLIYLNRRSAGSEEMQAFGMSSLHSAESEVH